MSDFDKEAEREKLREKYERDQAEREATERMSDLLLKGARMTNSHCGTCGDPFFEMDGTTFCPSCHGGPEGVEASVPDEHAESEPGEADTPTASTQSGDPETGSSTEPGDIEVETPTDRGDEVGGGRAEDSRDPRTAPSEPIQSEPAPSNTYSGTSQSNARQSGGTSAQPAPSGSLEDARDALTRALERYAREAAATDDPRYAKECLEAAREAAETLRTLR